MCFHLMSYCERCGKRLLSLALLDLILESFHVTGRLAGTSDGRMLGAFGRAKRGVVFHIICVLALYPSVISHCYHSSP